MGNDLAPLSAELLDELEGLALASALEAGELLIEGQKGALRVESKSSPTDVVTHMDRETERLLHDRLLGARPADGILGEEGAQEVGTSGFTWVVDPIDGTTNYLYGLPAWAVSIGVEFGGEAVCGVVHVPAMGETFTATLGRGAWLTSMRVAPTTQSVESTTSQLTVRPCADLASALVATGFGYQARRRRSQAVIVSSLLPRVRDIRRVGACSIDLCWLGAGRVDAYFERGVNPWDHSAGGLVAREAGARVEGLHGSAANYELLVAASPVIFPDLHDALAQARADRD